MRNTAIVAALLGILAGATGCARPANQEPTLAVDAEFSAYVARFEQDSAAHGKPVQVTDLVMRFGEVSDQPGEGARGVCEAAQGETPVVTISRDAWDASSDAEREELVFHELGHCLLGLTHEAGITDEGIPKSLMNPVNIDGAIYSQYRDYYVRTIFDRAR